MSIRHLLHDFGDLGWAPGDGAASEAGSGASSLEHFERGYKDGWDDAVAAGERDASHIGTELARNLQDMSFTYQEAHAAMVRAVRPLFEHMLNSVLPELARRSLAPLVAEQITAIAAGAGEAPVEICLNPADGDRIRSALGQDFGFPVELTEDDALIAGQVVLRFAELEREIHLPEALEAVRLAIEDFYGTHQKESPNER